MTYQAALQKIEQAKAEQWEELDLSGMELTEVPPEIGQLINLQSLNLSRNKIKVVPDSITQLINLQYLIL